MDSATQAEWDAWQAVVYDFRHLVGDINAPRYTALVKALARWGERLHALRSTQKPGTVAYAARSADDDFDTTHPQPCNAT